MYIFHLYITSDLISAKAIKEHLWDVQYLPRYLCGVENMKRTVSMQMQLWHKKLRSWKNMFSVFRIALNGEKYFTNNSWSNRDLTSLSHTHSLYLFLSLHHLSAVWPDWSIYCTLGNFSKPVATIILAKMFQIFRQFL